MTKTEIKKIFVSKAYYSMCLGFCLFTEFPTSSILLKVFIFLISVNLIYIYIPTVFNFIFTTTITIYCVYETIVGLLQIIGLHKSNHLLFIITGSFHNPGPYGGFLSVCISFLMAHFFKNEVILNNKFITKISHWSALIVAILSLIILPSTQSRSAMLALGCSMILLAFGTERMKKMIKPILKKHGLWLLFVATIIGIGAYLYKKPSADGRLFIDKICIKAMYENGWKGAGLGHFGRAYGDAQAKHFKEQIDEKGKDDLDWKAINMHERLTAECPDNAFNEYLFIGVESGLMALLFFIGIIIYAIVLSFKSGTIWCYGLTAFAVFALFSYPLHVKQFQVMLPILVAAGAADKGLSTQNAENAQTISSYIKRKNLIGYITTAIAFVLLSTMIAQELPEIRQHKQIDTAWNKVELWHQMKYYEYVVEDCDTLLDFLSNDQHFLFAYGQSLNKTGNYYKSDSILLLGTEISGDPMFWNVMGNNSLALGKYREAEERYKHAFYMVPNRLYPLYLLTKLYYIEGDTSKFIDMADKVETFIPKVESVNTEHLRAEIRDLKSGYLKETD